MVHHVIEMLSDRMVMPNMGSMRLPFIWSGWIGLVRVWSGCITIYCPCGQSVSLYIALIHIVHTVRVYYDMMYQFILFIWSVCFAIYCPVWSGCITIWCINLCYLHGQSRLPCIVRVARVYHDMMYQSMLSTWSACLGVSQYILPTWPECITICRFNPCCLHAQYV